MWPNLQENADLVTFTEEILNWKLHFSCNNSYRFPNKRDSIARKQNSIHIYSDSNIPQKKMEIMIEASVFVCPRIF